MARGSSKLLTAAIALVSLLDFAASVRAQPADSAAKPGPAAEIAATVNGKPILLADVDRALSGALQGRQLNSELLAALRGQTLSTLIDRRLVEEVLKEQGLVPADKEIDAAVQQVKAQAEQQNRTLEQLLKERNLTESDLREQLGWQLAWERYTEKHLTDDVLQKYFQDHAAEFDGTKLRVSHILLRPESAGNGAAMGSIVEKARRLRNQIEQGKITFEEAARKYSDGPSRHQAGDLGLIPRHGLMAEPFAQAAFALKKGQLSPPVITQYGVHLIRVTDVQPGSKKLAEVRDAIKPSAAQALFEQLAARQRPAARIEFGRAFAHLQADGKRGEPASGATP